MSDLRRLGAAGPSEVVPWDAWRGEVEGVRVGTASGNGADGSGVFAYFVMSSGIGYATRRDICQAALTRRSAVLVRMRMARRHLVRTAAGLMPQISLAALPESPWGP